MEIAFPQDHFKNWLFCLRCMQEIPRMAAKLRPVGRQTTPPGRAEEFPACSISKTAQFSHRSCGKAISIPASAKSRGPRTGPLQTEKRWNGPKECGGLSSCPQGRLCKLRIALFGRMRYDKDETEFIKRGSFMKLNTKRTILVGLAFLSISAFGSSMTASFP